MSKPRKPAGLGSKAAKTWDGIASVYDLRPDELRILEDACREIDIVEILEEALKGADLMVRGSMGQQVANPLLAEIRQHRATVERFLKGLKLPDDPGADKPTRSETARAAAQARWAS